MVTHDIYRYKNWITVSLVVLKEDCNMFFYLNKIYALKIPKNANNKNNDNEKLWDTHKITSNGALQNTPEISNESRKDRFGFPGRLLVH
jgi:hypothetical protein